MEFEAQPGWLILIANQISMSEDARRKQYHVHLLCDAGLMLPVNSSAFRMTSQGHDYLDAIRNDNIWTKTKAGAASVGGVTLGIMKDIAIGYLKQQVTEKLGIQLS